MAMVPPSPRAAELEPALAALRHAEAILLFTGAGISTESGIPDFRGPHGLWRKVDPEDFTIGRYRTSRATRVAGWRLHQRGELWGARSDTRPNPAHEALVELWRAGLLVGCVTQNVDGLHQAAGLPDEAVAELHGNARKARCLSCTATWPIEDVLLRVDAGDDDPHCLYCGGLIKTTTVMFGEELPADQMRRAWTFAAAADAILAVGSTMSVYPAAEVPISLAARGVPLVIVNMGPTEADELAVAKVESRAGEVLPPLVAEIIRARPTTPNSLTP